MVGITERVNFLESRLDFLFLTRSKKMNFITLNISFVLCKMGSSCSSASQPVISRESPCALRKESPIDSPAELSYDLRKELPIDSPAELPCAPFEDDSEACEVHHVCHNAESDFHHYKYYDCDACLALDGWSEPGSMTSNDDAL